MLHPLGPWSKDAHKKFMMIAAHPDDETLSASALLGRLLQLRIVHTTDGAPRDLADAKRSGFSTAFEYAGARREELSSALRCAAISLGQTDCLGLPDQESAFHLAAMTRALIERIRALEPDYLITHPYEGGHPDHDSAAFAARAACTLLEIQGRRPPRLLEFSSYHAFPGVLIKLEFLPPDPGHAYALSAEDRALKSRMIASFRTQKETLEQFPLSTERIRAAPDYDFLEPPHPGRLFYESFNWKIRGKEWRAAAKQALRELSLEGVQGVTGVAWRSRS